LLSDRRRSGHPLGVVGAGAAGVAYGMENERFHREAVGFGVDGAEEGADFPRYQAFDRFAELGDGCVLKERADVTHALVFVGLDEVALGGCERALERAYKRVGAGPVCAHLRGAASELVLVEAHHLAGDAGEIGLSVAVEFLRCSVVVGHGRAWFRFGGSVRTALFGRAPSRWPRGCARLPSPPRLARCPDSLQAAWASGREAVAIEPSAMADRADDTHLP